MAQKSSKIDDAMAGLEKVQADDPDMIAKLNAIAQKVARAQGKKLKSSNTNFDVNADPMDELGCEGCQ